MNRLRTVLVLMLLTFVAAGYFARRWKTELGGLPSPQSAVTRADDTHESQDAILAAYKLREKAFRDADGALWLSLQSRETLERITPAQKEGLAHFVAQPAIQYVPLASAAVNRHGAVIGRIDGSALSFRYEVIKYALEDGAWKIASESMSENPIDSRCLSAILPPADGAFSRAGSPWAGVPYAEPNTRFFKETELEWKMRATSDESFLYVRWEAKGALPPSGAEIHPDDHSKGSAIARGGPSAPPVMEIHLSGSGANGQARVFSLQTAAGTRTKATFGDDGRATSNRYFVLYQIALRDDKNESFFDNDSEDTFTHLVSVQERFLDVRIPLKSLDLDGKNRAEIDLKEGNSLAKILPYHVQPFSR